MSLFFFFPRSATPVSSHIICIEQTKTRAQDPMSGSSLRREIPLRRPQLKSERKVSRTSRAVPVSFLSITSLLSSRIAFEYYTDVGPRRVTSRKFHARHQLPLVESDLIVVAVCDSESLLFGATCFFAIDLIKSAATTCWIDRIQDELYDAVGWLVHQPDSSRGVHSKKQPASLMDRHSYR